MKKILHGTAKLIRPPAYPSQATQLLGDLRSRLIREEGSPIGFKELAKITGEAASTVHYRFTIYKNPHLIAFMTLLERLSPLERHSFIDARCRKYLGLAGSVCGQVGKIRSLLAQETGLTLITGGTQNIRTWVLTALGHSAVRIYGRGGAITGIDVHRPQDFVPVETLRYIDEQLESSQIRDLVISLWPKIMTARARIFIGNCLWATVPEVRTDLLRLADRCHVILAEQGLDAITDQAAIQSKRVHVISSQRNGRNGVIRVTCRKIKPRKSA